MNPRDKAWDKLSQEFFGVLSALKEQITPDHEAENNNQHQERLKGKRETWHQTASSVLLHIKKLQTEKVITQTTFSKISGEQDEPLNTADLRDDALVIVIKEVAYFAKEHQ